MTMTFQERLRTVMHAGALIKTDLKIWFKRPFPTVRTWVEIGYTPRGPQGELAHESLALLEKAVKARRGYFPVPRDLNHAERRRWIERARVSAAHPAR